MPELRLQQVLLCTSAHIGGRRRRGRRGGYKKDVDAPERRKLPKPQGSRSHSPDGRGPGPKEPSPGPDGGGGAGASSLVLVV
jgi:hypothetical protein